ncbi:MAG: hypothetical protein H0U22_06570 [Geodermatophilaceae bacterium]|nr:hypothetical protein [Geodermatophilaceae bacterium]
MTDSQSRAASRARAAGFRSDGRGSAASLLAQARTELVEAATEPEPEPRYARAHLAALRAAAAVLAQRSAAGLRPRRRGLHSAWDLLFELAPELGEWAGFFAAGAGKRAAAEAGLVGSVTAREADDLIREVATFCRLVERLTGGDRE